MTEQSDADDDPDLAEFKTMIKAKLNVGVFPQKVRDHFSGVMAQRLAALDADDPRRPLVIEVHESHRIAIEAAIAEWEAEQDRVILSNQDI